MESLELTSRTLLEDDRRRLEAARSKPSPLHAAGLSSKTALDRQQTNGGTAADQTQQPPAQSQPQELSEEQLRRKEAERFSLTKLAVFGEVRESSAKELVRGTVAQFRNPTFAKTQSTLRMLHSALSTEESGLSMIVEIQEASLQPGSMTQAGGGFLTSTVTATVKRANLNNYGLAFGTVQSRMPSQQSGSGNVRVNLHALCGGIEVVARSFDTEPLKEGEEVMLTVEPGCIRVHCARPRKAFGDWSVDSGAEPKQPKQQEENTAEGDEEAAEGSPSPKKRSTAARKRRRRTGDGTIIDILAFEEMSKEERLALQAKKREAAANRKEKAAAAAASKDQKEEEGVSQKDGDNFVGDESDVPASPKPQDAEEDEEEQVDENRNALTEDPYATSDSSDDE